MHLSNVEKNRVVYAELEIECSGRMLRASAQCCSGLISSFDNETRRVVFQCIFLYYQKFSEGCEMVIIMRYKIVKILKLKGFRKSSFYLDPWMI